MKVTFQGQVICLSFEVEKYLNLLAILIAFKKYIGFM